MVRPFTEVGIEDKEHVEGVGEIRIAEFSSALVEFEVPG